MPAVQGASPLVLTPEMAVELVLQSDLRRDDKRGAGAKESKQQKAAAAQEKAAAAAAVVEEASASAPRAGARKGAPAEAAPAAADAAGVAGAAGAASAKAADAAAAAVAPKRGRPKLAAGSKKARPAKKPAAPPAAPNGGAAARRRVRSAYNIFVAGERERGTAACLSAPRAALRREGASACPPEVLRSCGHALCTRRALA